MDEINSATKEILGIIGMINNRDGSTSKDITSVVNLLHGNTDPALIHRILSFAVSEGVLQCKNRRYKVCKQKILPVNHAEIPNFEPDQSYERLEDSKDELTTDSKMKSSSYKESSISSEPTSVHSDESFVSNVSLNSKPNERKRKSKWHLRVKYPMPKKIRSVETKENVFQSEDTGRSIDNSVHEDSEVTSSENVINENKVIELINDHLQDASIQEIFSRENVDRNKAQTNKLEDCDLNNEMKNIMKRVCMYDEQDAKTTNKPKIEMTDEQTTLQSITGAVSNVVKRIFKCNQENGTEDETFEVSKKRTTGESAKQSADDTINKVMKSVNTSLSKDASEMKENSQYMSKIISKVLEKTASPSNGAFTLKSDNVKADVPLNEIIRNTLERTTKYINNETQITKRNDESINEIMSKVIRKSLSSVSKPPEMKDNNKYINEVMSKVIDRIDPFSCNDKVISTKNNEIKPSKDDKTNRQFFPSKQLKNQNPSKEKIRFEGPFKYSTRSKVKPGERRDRSKSPKSSGGKTKSKEYSSSDEDNYDYMCSSTHSVGEQFPPYF